MLEFGKKLNACIARLKKHLAKIIENKNLDALKQLLEGYPDIEIPFRHFFTVINNGDTSMLKFLIEKKKIHNLDQKGGLTHHFNTLLLEAIQTDKLNMKKKYEIVETLLQAGANPDITGVNGTPALRLVMGMDEINAEKWLDLFLKYKANLNLWILDKKLTKKLYSHTNQSPSKISIFTNMIFCEQWKLALRCIEKSKIPLDLSQIPQNDITLLGNFFLAVTEEKMVTSENQEQQIKILEFLAKNRDIDEAQAEGNITDLKVSALYHVCNSTHKTTLYWTKHLIEKYQADPNLYFDKATEYSPFLGAIEKENRELVQYLLKQKVVPLTEETLTIALQYCHEHSFNAKIREIQNDIEENMEYTELLKKSTTVGKYY